MDQKPPRSATIPQRPPPASVVPSARQLRPHPATTAQRKSAPHPATTAQRKPAPHPATTAQRKVAPHPATTAQRKVAPHAAIIVQRAQAPVEAAALAEGECGEVASGKTLKFTALAAGCMAVAVNLDAGGGVGVHMAMNMPNQQQWDRFVTLLNGRKVASVTVYGDMVGNKQGWYFKFVYNPDLWMVDAPVTNQSPRSLSSLQAAGVDTGDASGWMWDTGSVSDWFKAAFGAKKFAHKPTDKAVDHPC